MGFNAYLTNSTKVKTYNMTSPDNTVTAVDVALMH